MLQKPTIRATDCELLLSVDSQYCRCRRCINIRSLLRTALSRFNRIFGGVSHKTDVASHVNNRFLNLEERQEKLEKQHHSIRLLKKKLDRLKSKIATITDQVGFNIGPETTSDLSTIMEGENRNVQKLYPEGSFQRIFWDQQLEAAKYQKACNMKWHPLMIKWCLYLRYKSSGAYELLRESGCVKLPSQRTLRDYTHVIKKATGFSLELDAQLMKAADIECLEMWQKCVMLILDEMKIREDLVYDKCTDELIGFTDLGDINNHLLQFEKSLQDQQIPTLADSMLVFMVGGLFISLQYPYAQFPCASITGDLLYNPVWEAVYRLERCGFQVQAN